MTEPDELSSDVSWARVREAWPGIEIPREVFVAFATACAARSSSIANQERHPLREPLDVLVDLYLTCGCARGVPAALMQFETRYAPLFDSIRARFRTRGPSLDELIADVRVHLFVARPNAPPRIVEYSGWVELGAWLRIVVTRLVLNRLASTRSDSAVDDKVLDGLLVTWQTPEASVLRDEAHRHFRTGLRRALRQLTARDKTVLRLAFGEGLSIDDVAALYGVHRTTAFRWIQRASERLGTALQRIVRDELGLEGADYDAWCAALRSQLELSIERYFNCL